MKKIFTLLFALVALTAAADNNTMVDRCINVLLGNEQPTTLMATNLDANSDGAVTIDDVAVLVDIQLWGTTGNINHAPAQVGDIDALVNKVLETKVETPNIDDVKKAVDKNLRNDAE